MTHRHLHCFLAAAICATLLGCQQGQPGKEKPAKQPEEDPTKVSAFVLHKGPSTFTLEATGALKAFKTAAVSPQVTATVRGVHVTDTQAVEQGQLLVSLDTTDVELGIQRAQQTIAGLEANLAKAKKGPVDEEIARAKANLKSANAQLSSATIDEERFRKLYQQGAIPKRDYDSAKLTLTVAKGNAAVAKQTLKQLMDGTRPEDIQQVQTSLGAARVELKNLRVQQSRHRITAPIGGQVEGMSIREGEMAAAGRPVLSIVNLSQLEILAPIPEKDLAALDAIKRATVTTDAYPGVTYRGDVTGISPATDQQARSALVRLVVDNHDGKLKSGLFARVAFEEEASDPGWYVPQEAVLEDPEGEYLFAVDRDRAKRIDVTTERTRGNMLKLTKGDLIDGMRVVLQGNLLVKTGTKVQVTREVKGD